MFFIFGRFFVPGPVLPGSLKTSNATRKAPELSGSISCRAFYLFTYLPGLPGHMKNEGQFCFSGVFLCSSCVSHLRKIRKFPHSSIYSFCVALMYGDHCSCTHPKHLTLIKRCSLGCQTWPSLVADFFSSNFSLVVDQPSHRKIEQVCELCSGARV